MSRLQEQSHLLTALTFLASPIEQLVRSSSTPPDRHAFARIDSKFATELELFRHELRTYCNPGGYYFQAEYDEANRIVTNLRDHIRQGKIAKTPQDFEGIRAAFENNLRAAHAALLEIPCEDDPAIHPAEFPFQTYLRIRALITAVRNRVDLLDPYLAPEVFHRYLSDVPTGATLTVLTSDKVMNDPGKTRQRDGIVAISELVARERPAGKYRFLVSGTQHDRHCRIDDDILHLGGSLAHASYNDPYTISRLYGSANHSHLDSLISGATEWFGSSTPRHRRA